MRKPLPIRLLAVLTLIFVTFLLGACDDDPGSEGPRGDGAGATLVAREGFEVLDWDDLLPPDWQPEALLEELEVENIPDDDPRAVAIMEQIMELWNAAPTVPLLAGRRISLTGFLVPLDFESDVLSEFLLIPYYGGCIHVPPPPPIRPSVSSCPRAGLIRPASLMSCVSAERCASNPFVMRSPWRPIGSTPSMSSTS
jgi:uncharacterized protein